MLSVLIIALNNEDIIEACIKSVKWADEIIVIDNGSSDKTPSIAKQLGAQVFETQARSFAQKRNDGLKRVKGEYLLCIDTDERVTRPLKDEINSIIAQNPREVAWSLPRKNIILGEVKQYKAFWPDRVIRLFKTEHLTGWSGEVHEQPQFDGSLGKLKSPLLHLTHRDVDSMVLKSLDWANIDAKLRFDAHHPPMTTLRFLRIIFTETWNQGITRQGFFNGTVGTIDALIQMFSLFLSYAKLWQIQRSESLAQTYKKIDQKLIENGFSDQ